MKVYKSLSKYLLDKSGAVFMKSDGTQVEPMKSGVVRLVTDEIFVSQSGKRSNIVRRFTKDEILQRYNHKDAVDESKVQDTVVQKPAEQTKTVEVQEVSNKVADGNEIFEHQLSSKGFKVGKNVIDRTDEEVYQYEINGKKYRNAGEAGKDLGIAPNTVTNRVKKGVEGYKSLI